MSKTSDLRKVALVGTLCVGKTSVFNALRDKYANDPNFAFVEEAARRCLSERNLTSHDIDEKMQNVFQDIVVNLEKSAANAGASFIVCDRSIIDSVAYSHALGDEERAGRLLSRASHWLPTYHRFVLLDPAGVLYREDDVRKESPEYRSKVHESFLKLLTLNGYAFDVASGSLSDRLKKVENILLN